jgi:hypothetical protein
MATYILDIKTQKHSIHDSNGCYVEYYFKIDNNGNVDISKFKKCQDGTPARQGGDIEQVLKIIDNIPIPNYFIDIINFLINPSTIEDIENYERTKCDYLPGPTLQWQINSKNSQLTERYLEIVANTIKRIKENVKKIVENPQDNLDIKTQLDTFITKTTLQQENIVGLETKIENIQTSYFDVLNDNKKLKEIVKTNNHKQTELECEINRLKGEINTMKQLDEYNKLEQQKMEELETEGINKWVKLQKQNYNPLYR